MGLTDSYAPDEWRALADIYGTDPAAAPPDPALVALVAVCEALKLDPMAGLLYLATVDDERWDSAQGQMVPTVRRKPAIRRDGLVSIAEMRADYRGMQFGVVHANDQVDVIYEGTPETDPKVEHAFSLAADRGPVLGAWAKCYVKDRGAVFYFASIEEHGRWRDVFVEDATTGERTPKIDETTGKQVRELDDAWGYLSATILAAAQSYVLRLGLGVTGVIPADEMRSERATRRRTRDGGGTAADLVQGAAFDWSVIEDQDLRDQLQGAVADANLVSPESWTDAKLALFVSGALSSGDPAGVLAQLAQRIGSEASEMRFRKGIDPGEGADAEAGK